MSIKWLTATKKILNKVSNTKYAVAAAVSVAAMSASALAADNSGITAKNIADQVGEIGRMTVAGMFLLEIVAIGAGLSKLKQAAEAGARFRSLREATSPSDRRMTPPINSLRAILGVCLFFETPASHLQLTD